MYVAECVSAVDSQGRARTGRVSIGRVSVEISFCAIESRGWRGSAQLRSHSKHYVDRNSIVAESMNNCPRRSHSRTRVATSGSRSL